MKIESFKEFKIWWITQPLGTIIYRVHTFDGNTGDKVGVDYSTEESDLNDMLEVSEGYYTETAVLTKIEPTPTAKGDLSTTQAKDYIFTH